jgi:autotransporter translocation and assembly factor TamB
MSRAISDLTNLEVSASVDTSEEGAPRPELGIRINPRLSVAVSYAPNPTPSLGRPPDEGIVSLDWRVSRRWTLESAFGDSGSASTDLVWRLRY